VPGSADRVGAAFVRDIVTGLLGVESAESTDLVLEPVEADATSIGRLINVRF